MSDSPGLPERQGYDPMFLGVAVPLPVPVHPTELLVLPYTHFSVLLRPDRRLAAATVVAIDGASLVDLVRSRDRWSLDPRVPESAQAGEELYRDNELDRGHLVRRLDPVWGQAASAQQANDDTFHFTNAAPQHAGFNQSKLLWLGLESYLLEHAASWDRRLVVMTGPVLAARDPLYRGVRVPLRFWKVAAAMDATGTLTATAYVLDQTPLVDDVRGALATAEEAGQAPPLGAFRTFQVPVADVVAISGLDLGPLLEADLLAPQPSAAPAARGSWVQLHELSDVVLPRVRGSS